MIYFSSLSVGHTERALNEDLAKLSSWLNKNRLTLNISKSKFMLIGSPHKICCCNSIDLIVDNVTLESTSTFKYLGVTINKNMTWCDHVEAISSKVNQRVTMLKRIRHLLPVEMRSTLYNSLILPVFDYADTIWGDKFNATLMEDLQLLQNKAAKPIILDLPSFSSSTQALEALGWQTLARRRLLHRCVLIYKYVIRDLPNGTF